MQIEENQRQNQIITGEHLPLCSLSLIKKNHFDNIDYSKQ